MSYHLVVVAPFGNYKRGDTITDDKAIKKALGEHASEVVKVAAPPKK